MTTAFASIVISSCRLRSAPDLAKALSLAPPNEAWSKHIALCYSISHQFVFNPILTDALEVTYLGGSSEPTKTLQDVWADYVHIYNRTTDVAYLHMHFHFGKRPIAFHKIGDLTIGKMAVFLRHVYEFFESEEQDQEFERLAILNRFIREKGPLRKWTYNLSRYSYVSVLLPKGERLAPPGSDAVSNVYRLLFLDANAVDAQVAERHLASSRWASESFFMLFSQPGGIVTVATPHPETEQDAHQDWFFPEPPNLVPDGVGYVRNKPEYYDLLPEYPPLRYLAVPSLQFAGGLEETLRDVYEEMLDTSKTLSHST